MQYPPPSPLSPLHTQEAPDIDIPKRTLRETEVLSWRTAGHSRRGLHGWVGLTSEAHVDWLAGAEVLQCVPRTVPFLAPEHAVAVHRLAVALGTPRESHCQG